LTIPDLNSSRETTKLNKGIRIGHINVRDILLRNKKDEVRKLLEQHNYDILAITETWLWKEINDEGINIDGYNSYREDRPSIKTYNTRGGGILVYIEKSYTVELVPHFFTNNDKVQAIKLKITKHHMKPVIVYQLRIISSYVNWILNLKIISIMN